MSVPLHSSVTGHVKAIEKHPHPTGKLIESIIVATDGNSPQVLFDEHPIEWRDKSPKELLSLIQGGGFVGLGGAAFPTHVKFSIPEGKHVEWFMVNGSECEPYLTTDHRMMLEWAESIVLGVRIVSAILGTNGLRDHSVGDQISAGRGKNADQGRAAP